MNEILVFETENKNKYIFDNVSGEVFHYEELFFEILNNYYKYSEEDLISMLSEKYDMNTIKNKYEYVTKLLSMGLFYPKGESDITKKDVYMESLARNLTSQLFLVLTHSCNLRCKYCIYSDNYPNTITYDNRKMTFDVAKKAIDYYMKLYNEKVSHGYRNNPIINFYGGEPLLEFNLIKKVVEYCKTYDHKFEFYMTTNGTIMDQDIINLIVENEFRVTVSLDGNKVNHDRNRVFCNDKGTFDVILQNLIELQREKLNRGVIQPISFNCCYDNYSNMIEIVKFFEENSEKLGCAALMFSEVNPYDTDYSEYCDGMYNCNDEDFKSDNFNKTYKKVFQEYRDILHKHSEDLSMPLKFLFASVFYTKNLPKGSQGKLGNACIPGSKIAVSPDGNFYVCEKINEKHCIGDIEKGLDWNSIEKILKEYLDIKDKHCKDCNISRLCECCYVHFSMNDSDKQLFNEQFCEDKKTSIPKTLSKVYSILEKNGDCLEIKNKENKNDFVKMTL